MIYRKITVIFLCLSFFLGACSGLTSIEADEIKLSSFQSFGEINEDLIKVITDEREVKTIEDLLNQASEESGSVDMPEGDYTIELVDEDGSSEAYHLWIEDPDSQGTIMSVDDTSTIYTLSKSKKEELRTALIK